MSRSVEGAAVGLICFVESVVVALVLLAVFLLRCVVKSLVVAV